MKQISAPVLALLQSGQPLVITDLYTFTLLNGTVLRYCDFDTDLMFGSNTYLATGPLFGRGKTRQVIGVEVDTLDITVYPAAADTVNGVGFLEAVATGRFDGCLVRLDRAFLSPVPTVLGIVNMFVGSLADTVVSRTKVDMRVNSQAAMLNINLPRNVYQAACLHTLYDAQCGLARASFVVAGTTLTGSTAATINAALAQAAGYFSRGYIEYTSGINNGLRRTVKSHATNLLSLLNPFPKVPGVGDTFNVYPGCDKKQATCTATFNNVAQFRGFPYVPNPESAI